MMSHGTHDALGKVRPSAMMYAVLSAVVLFAWVTPYFAALVLFYPGSSFVAFAFALASGTLILAALARRSSAFSVSLATFLTLGFPLKLLVHLIFEVPLIEPIGQFDGSAPAWDRALIFASTGLAAAAGAMVLPMILGAWFSRDVRRSQVLARIRPGPFVAACLLVSIGAAIAYALNAHLDILRIGYHPKVALPFPLYPALAFIITWGALLGGLSLCWWLVERGQFHPASLVYVATALGIAAALSMGSRVQLLLYVLAALFAVSAMPGKSPLRQLCSGKTVLAMGVAAIAFLLSLAVVSIQRSIDFEPMMISEPSVVSESAVVSGPAVTASPEAGDLEDVHRRLSSILRQVGNLFVMRWVGLEGTLTATGVQSQAGTELLVAAMLDDPARGTAGGVYQRLSESPYEATEGFTFLTIPGPIGLAALGGDPFTAAVLIFLFVLAGRTIEAVSGVLVRNAATSAVCGVSLAYLLVQMNAPWTLLVYAVELLGAVVVLALARYAVFSGTVRASPQEPTGHGTK